MNMTVAIAAGGALGALSRYWVSIGVHKLAGGEFPYGTLTVNVAGSLLMGALYVLFIERMGIDPVWRGALLIGLLGAFTTFSTFSIETLNLVENGESLRAVANVAASVILCIAACWIGMVAGRQL
ncbi:MAG TPA: fluoride efflux transporter CrcB [Gammaproteobacteria bacterium]|nr:fluoride efflux transporter CrcB [Gammaproteobacteria bacterium]